MCGLGQSVQRISRQCRPLLDGFELDDALGRALLLGFFDEVLFGEVVVVDGALDDVVGGSVVLGVVVVVGAGRTMTGTKTLTGGGAGAAVVTVTGGAGAGGCVAAGGAPGAGGGGVLAGAGGMTGAGGTSDGVGAAEELVTGAERISPTLPGFAVSLAASTGVGAEVFSGSDWQAVVDSAASTAVIATTVRG